LFRSFMSAAPRPYSTPSSIVGMKGGVFQASAGPGGTTSVWPAKHSTGAVVPRRAHRLQTPPPSMRSRVKPSGARRSAMSSRQPASSGVTEGRAMSSQARASVAWVVMWGALGYVGPMAYGSVVIGVEGEFVERRTVGVGGLEVHHLGGLVGCWLGIGRL